MIITIPNIDLNSGRKMPILGMGTWHHGHNDEIKNAVKFAVRNGYRHIDAAYRYKNEDEVGEAIKELIEDNVVKREDLFIVSKLWNTFHNPDHVEEGLMKSLKALNVDYLDLYLIHWPTAFKYGTVDDPADDEGHALVTPEDYIDTWRGMEKLVEKGLVKDIGVCNFNSMQLKRVLDNCTIKPAVLQVESNPRIHNEILRKFCQKHGIVMVGYSPFGSPDLPWGERLPHLLQDETLQRIAMKHKKSTAQVILRWQVQRNVGIIPKSVFENELLDNLKVFDFKLDDGDMEVIRKLDRNLRKIYPIVRLKDGTIEKRDIRSPFNAFEYVETEECLKD